jgi:hypothetical protein
VVGVGSVRHLADPIRRRAVNRPAGDHVGTQGILDLGPIEPGLDIVEQVGTLHHLWR